MTLPAFVLIVILLAPDYSGYHHAVGLFPTKAECDKVLTDKLKEAATTGLRYSLSCQKLAGGTPA